MAEAWSKISNLGPILWSVLFLVCIGLVVAHLVTASLEQLNPEQGLIERTFTQAPANR